MQLIYTPTIAPGCCFICRAAQRDSYIDTDVTKDYDGAFYICNLCVGQMAVMYSYLSFDEYKDIRQSNEELQRQNFALIKRLGEMEGIEDALANAGYKRDDDGSIIRTGGYLPQASSSGEERASGAETELGVGEGTSVEQSYDEGVGELRSNESSSDSDFSLNF